MKNLTVNKPTKPVSQKQSIARTRRETTIANTEMITATELLEFHIKLRKLSIIVTTYTQTDKGYKITLNADWHDDDNWYKKTVFIDNEGRSDWNNGGDYDFYTMDRILDEKLEEQKHKEIRVQKRKELIESLTPEQRELLGV